MNIKSYISSGILEAYCFGQLSEKELMEVDKMAIDYQEVNAAINHIYENLPLVLPPQNPVINSVQKIKTFNSIYKLDAGINKLFPPFVESNSIFQDFPNYLISHNINFEYNPDLETNIMPLPSDEFVTNFLAWVKFGHEEEIHTNYLEYIAVLEGSCTMQFEDNLEYFNQGSIIQIPMNIMHKAVVTSNKPMLALVQRQIVHL